LFSSLSVARRGDAREFIVHERAGAPAERASVPRPRIRLVAASRGRVLERLRVSQFGVPSICCLRLPAHQLRGSLAPPVPQSPGAALIGTTIATGREEKPCKCTRCKKMPREQLEQEMPSNDWESALKCARCAEQARPTLR